MPHSPEGGVLSYIVLSMVRSLISFLKEGHWEGTLYSLVIGRVGSDSLSLGAS